MKAVVITGADRGIGYALCEEFLSGGYRVFAGQFLPEWPQLAELQKANPSRLEIVPLDVGNTESVRKAADIVSEKTQTVDFLVNVAGVFQGDSRQEMEWTFRVNSFGPLRVTEAFLPLMHSGEKRLCYFSSEAGSVSLLHRTEGYAYCASKTMLNMAVKLMFNSLRERGYTFRLYHPGWVKTYMSGEKSEVGVYEPEESARAAYLQFTGNAVTEDVLLMTDIKGEIWSF